MLNISIHADEKNVYASEKGIFVPGVISIKNFQETLDIPLHWWGMEKYKKQWSEGLSRIHIQQRSCLVTAILGSDKKPFVEWWLLYKKQSKVYVYNEVLFEQEYINVFGKSVITPENCYTFIPKEKEKKIFPNGLKESVWIVDLSK